MSVDLHKGHGKYLSVVTLTSQLYQQRIWQEHYDPSAETVISLDFVTRHLHDYNAVLDTSPEARENTENDIACRVTSNFMNDTLELEGMIVLNGVRGQYGALQRFSATYDLMDNWSVKGGALLFQAREGAMAPVGDSGRIFCELRYDF